MNMCRIAATSIVAVAGLASVTLADGRVTMTDATGFYNGTDGSGGAFTATKAADGVGANYNGSYVGEYGGNGTSGNTYLTFCLEEHENIGFGGTYYAQISTSAMAGGSGYDPATNTTAPAGSDPLSPVTARIYTEFRNSGNFGGNSTDATFADGYNTSAETTAIQNAIWYSEGEKTLGDIGGNTSLAYKIWNWANTNNNGMIGNVRVLRLWTSYNTGSGYSGFAQDQLVLVPLPAGAYAGLGTLAGVLGFGAIRRRRHRSE